MQADGIRRVVGRPLQDAIEVGHVGITARRPLRLEIECANACPSMSMAMASATTPCPITTAEPLCAWAGKGLDGNARQQSRGIATEVGHAGGTVVENPARVPA
jgi:hypothetical protein